MKSPSPYIPYSLYKELRHHRRLALRRHPLYERNRFAKLLTYLFVGVWIVYLIAFGLLAPVIFREISPEALPYQTFNQGLPYLLALDFLFRLRQDIPVQEIKPYLLLPVGRRRLIHFFLFRSAISGYNFFWFALLVPFSLSGVLPYQGFAGVFGFLTGYWILLLINNYWYLLCRTLINEHAAFVLLPVAIYGSCILSSLLLPEEAVNALAMQLGEGFIRWDLAALLVPLGLLVLFYIVNLKMQEHVIYKELSKTETIQPKHLSEYSFLERWGETGEFIRLEIKLRLRNKAVRTQFRNALLCMLFFSVMLSFSSAYDKGFMKEFVCLYNFAAIGVITLSQIMSVEGNYLDGLMSRKESVLSLLKAKYYFNTALLIVPLLLSVPAILMGKTTWLATFTYLFLTAGPVYLLLFQLTVYNKQTFPLTEQQTGRNATGGYYQSLITTGAFLSPILLNNLMVWLCGPTTGRTILLVIGIAVTLTHNWWLHNIYVRFMKRRYTNMEGFRLSR